MVTQGLPVSTFVDINTSASVGGVLRRPFGRGLLITTDDALAAGGTNKARLYNNLAEMQVDFSIRRRAGRGNCLVFRRSATARSVGGTVGYV